MDATRIRDALPKVRFRMANRARSTLKRASIAAVWAFILAPGPTSRLVEAQPPRAPFVHAGAGAEQVSTAFSANDVGRLMEEVYRTRNASWQRLGSFSLQETSTVEIRMPWDFHGSPYRREQEYEWSVDDVVVRRPLRRDGAVVGERARTTAEKAWLREATHRRAIRDRRLAEDRSRVDCLLPGTTTHLEPKFIEDFYYFAEFTCAPGRFYLVGWEQFAGREVVRIEYHPENVDDGGTDFAARLFDGVRRTSLITFWVDPTARQIVKYTVVSRELDFLPARWLLRVKRLEATMEMVQVADGWLPKRMTLSGRGATALGEFRADVVSEFSGHRQLGTDELP